MPLLITFPTREDGLRAIDVLAEAEETYHGVPSACYVISDSAARVLQAKGVHFQVVGDKEKESVRAASA